jgi:hypothetical protein
MRRKALVLTGFIIVLLAISFFYVRSTPHYSLYQLKRAVENHDPDEALKYINIDSIVDNLGMSFFGKGEGDGNQGEGKGPSIKRLVANALPGIKESVRSSFRSSIASGSGAKQRERATVQPQKNQAPYIGGIEIGGLDLRKIKETSLWDLIIEKDGKTAMVRLKNTPGIKAKMEKTEVGYWQVVEIILSP